MSTRNKCEPKTNVNQQVHSFFFYKNKVYKNVEPQFLTKTKNILYAEMGSNSQLFLIFLTEPQKRAYVLKR